MSYKQSLLPRWRGFNLLGMFMSGHNEGLFPEEHFQLISDWGFDFVRIPMSYRFWTKSGDITPDEVYKINEQGLSSIDDCIRFGEKYGIHVNLNFHRAPGYCVNDTDKEPFDLWHDSEAEKAFAWHWQLLAKRYKGISSDKLSFDLVNEPLPAKVIGRDNHKRVVTTAVNTIREISPDRLIVADGLSWGNDPCPELAELKIGESCRAYSPTIVSHYQADWMGWKGDEPVPTWPDIKQNGEVWNKERLYKHYEQWAKMASELGLGVHCGEGGAHNRTPHNVTLAWLDDVMDVLKGFNIGYALWNLTGSFGVLDSGRSDVAYEDYKGHKLDRKMLELLQKY